MDRKASSAGTTVPDGFEPLQYNTPKLKTCEYYAAKAFQQDVIRTKAFEKIRLKIFYIHFQRFLKFCKIEK